MSQIPTEAGYDGYACAWYYLDQKNHALSQSLPSGTAMSSKSSVNLSIRPLWLNAPGQAIGTNNGDRFQGQGKPTAYLKVQVTQTQAAANNNKPVTWAALYPLIDNWDDDITNRDFQDPVQGDPIQAVPIPRGAATLQTPLTAVVGGPKQTTLLGIIKSVLGLAASMSGKALFPIPQADLTLASTVEDLLNLAANAFAPGTKQQYWINDGQKAIATSSAAPTDSDTLQLPLGSSKLVAFPTMKDDAALNALATILQANYNISTDPNGTLIASKNSAPVSPSPFANLIYVTFYANVTES